MAASDAKPFPRKNQAYRATFPIMDNDGDLVTGATGLDSEVSKDAGTFADCTNEATEIATSSGMYYLDLTATEMNADTVAVKVKSTSTDSKDTVLVFYPSSEGTAADGVEPTIDEAIFEILALLGEKSISGTTVTVKSSQLATLNTYTLDSATDPTSITKAT